jgi:hypothetical protein
MSNYQRTAWEDKKAMANQTFGHLHNMLEQLKVSIIDPEEYDFTDTAKLAWCTDTYDDAMSTISSLYSTQLDLLADMKLAYEKYQASQYECDVCGRIDC